jgi:ABC-type nitrate/sulfonate/bicarbonate transport system substrate-binding protein
VKKVLWFLFLIPILHSSAQAADKIRIGFPELIASYSSLRLGQKRGFLQEEGLQAEFIRMNSTVGLATLITGDIDYYTQLGGRGRRGDRRGSGQNRGLLRAWSYRYAHLPA